MNQAAAPAIVGYVRSLAVRQTLKEAPDRVLLERFAGQRDETAFAMIVRRHGGMVQQLCQSLLHNRADADDAFQATFLVLARKAPTIRKQGSLGSWLYGVAYRTALRAKAARNTRKRHEAAQVRAASQPDAADALTWREAQWVLHQELARLPEKYRAPLVLCYLAGKRQDEAERLLGWRDGKLRSMLERARALLRKRLQRRGLGPGAVLVVATVFSGTAVATPPVALIVNTAQAATLVAAGSKAGWAAVSAPVRALAEDVLRSLAVGKMKVAVCGLLLVAVLGLGRQDPGTFVPPGHPVDQATARPPTVRAVTTQVGEDAVLSAIVSARASSSWLPYLPGQAFDGDGATYWNSGNYAPQWIEADLGNPTQLVSLSLVVAQMPAGPTTHELWVADAPIDADRAKARLVHASMSHTADGQQLNFDFPPNLRARHVQIRSTQSPSWIGWWSVDLRVRRADGEHLCAVDKVDFQNKLADAKKEIGTRGDYLLVGVDGAPLLHVMNGPLAPRLPEHRATDLNLPGIPPITRSTYASQPP